MLFASLILERMPLYWGNFPDSLCMWLQNAGAVAALGIFMVFLIHHLQRDSIDQSIWNLPPRLQFFSSYFIYIYGAVLIAYACVVVGWIGVWLETPGVMRLAPRHGPGMPFTAGDWFLTAAGVLALSIALMPMLVDLTTRISWGRIWAIARLSWKEAIRGRVIWVFGAMALVFLFADWFVPFKAEDQVRNYVRVVYWSMTPLFLITAALLGSFSIPNDVRNNSIHTIVTKPVEKFEIVLGRFIGYAALLTIGLFVVASVSLIYVVRGVNDDAKQESFKARVPIYGFLHFAGTKDQTKGESVGREWGYRTYIQGQTQRQRGSLKQYAVWDFPIMPQDVIDREEPILFEFNFDIFRLSKGEEGKGLYCSFTFVDVSKFVSTDPTRQSQELEAKSNAMKEKADKLLEEARARHEKAAAGMNEQARTQLAKQQKEELQKIELDIIKEFRIYSKTEEVSDYHTQTAAIPKGIFKHLINENPKFGKDNEMPVPALRVFVSVNESKESQMLGVAQPDFYILAYERDFWQNFLKGVVGMWCTHMLVLGIAIACSTYLTGIISLLTTLFLFTAGMFGDYLRDVAESRTEGGGPFEATFRLGTRLNTAATIDDSPGKTVLQSMDKVFSWWIGRIINLLPDINRHDLHPYVANGFDISWADVLFLDNFLPLVGYLIPWAILAYYMMKYREIANPS